MSWFSWRGSAYFRRLAAIGLVTAPPGCTERSAPVNAVESADIRSEPGFAGSDAAGSANSPGETEPPESSEAGSSTSTPTSAPTATLDSLPPLLDASPDTLSRVQGRLIDFWGHPVPKVEMRVGKRDVTTDEYGNFTADGVDAPYDVTLALRILGDVTELYGWHFVGLTRRDPVLQVYKALTQHTAPFSFSVTGLGQDERWRGEIAIGGEHGQRAYPISESLETVAGWRGPSPQDSALRLLLWSVSEEAPSVPSAFLHTEERVVTLSEAEPVNVDFALSEAPTPLPAFSVGFTTTNAPDVSHLATSYLRFNDGPSIQLAQVPRLSDDTVPFMALAPQLPDTSVTLAALSGNGANSRNFVITYAPAVQPDTTVNLTFPVVSALSTPDEAVTDVTYDTPFTWTDTAGAYVLVLEDLGVFQTVFVVTSEPEARVPNLEHLGIYYPHGGSYRWTVESHGDAEDIDDLCAGPGYLDPYSGDFLYPIGPRAGRGRFWRTAARNFAFD